MSNTTVNTSQPKMVKRFTKPIIFVHWLNATAFFALFLTGLPLYTETFDFLYPVFGGPASARLLHRIFAVMFIMPTFIAILFDPKSFFHWIKQIFTWRKNDVGFFLPFAKEFFGGKSEVPPQGYYNAGEKVNSLLQILMAIFIITSGIVMWFPHLFPAGLVNWAYPMHDIGVGLAVGVVVGHVYMSVFQAKGSLHGMTKGDVTIDFAKEHYPLWVEELEKEKKHA